MTLIKKEYINLSIILLIILNIIIGIFLIIASFSGHSSFGVLIGVLTPLAAIAFYSDGYNILKSKEIESKSLKEVFKPSIKIALLILILMSLLITYVLFLNGFTTFSFDYLFFGLMILLIFIIPNIICQMIFYFYLRKKINNKTISNTM